MEADREAIWEATSRQQHTRFLIAHIGDAERKSELNANASNIEALINVTQTRLTHVLQNLGF